MRSQIRHDLAGTELFVLDAANPGPMTGAGNHTYLLASSGHAVLVDAGVGHPDHLDALRQALDVSEAALQTVAITHGHPDHAAGAPALAEAHPAAVFARGNSGGRLADERRADERREYGIRWQPLNDGDRIECGAASLAVVGTPGHSPDHLAFWHEPTRALFTGDLLIAGGSVVIDTNRGGDMKEYLQSLERVLGLEPERLFPAHGPRVDDPARIVRESIEHRRMRERQVIAAVEAGHRTVEAIAESIYHGLDPRLTAAARENVRAHLMKLAGERVVADRGGWRIP
jgi:glyoxylase-like metal-dependent hydrolase (beta-lactamase superfamily II)